MFDIFLTDELATEPVSEGLPGAKAVYGNICIGEVHETFIARLYHWSHLQYEQQWLTALRRVVEGANRSLLITSYVEPPLVVTSDDYLVWWPLYRAEDVVYVQNQMLFFKTLKAPFSIECPWEFVRDRQAVNAEGL